MENNQSLTSTINRPMDAMGALGIVSSAKGPMERGRKAREVEPFLIEEEARAKREKMQSETEAKRQQLEREAQSEIKYADIAESGVKEYQEASKTEVPRNIEEFNAEKATELAVLTAVLGAFTGTLGGRAALMAMDGVAEGYRQGKQDLYQKQLKAYDDALKANKEKLDRVRTGLEMSLKAGQARRGAEIAQAKLLAPEVAGSSIEADIRLGMVGRALEKTKKAQETLDLIERKRIEAGMGAVTPSITEIVNPDNPSEVLRIDAKQYQGGGVGSKGVIGLVPPKETEKKVREDEQKTAYNTNRILTSAQQISNIVKKEADAEAPGFWEALVSSLPIIDAATNVVRGADRQVVASAQADIIDSLLFLATGAAYNKEQLAQQRLSYLPLWSDKQQALVAKRDRLRGLIEGAKIRAGAAWRPEMDTALQSLFIGPIQEGAQTGGQAAPAPTQQSAPTPQGVSQELTQRPGESRLEFLRRKQAAGALER